MRKTVSIIAEKMVFGGNCAAKIDGKTVFVGAAIPGETLDVEIMEEKKDFARARIVEVVKPSERRVHGVCPFSEKCGGCDMIHIDSGFQVELRKKILAECFSRAGVETREIDAATGSALGTRCRIQTTRGGFFARSTNEIFRPTKCVNATREINEWLSSDEAAGFSECRAQIFGDSRVTRAGGVEGRKAIAVRIGERADARKKRGAPEALRATFGAKYKNKMARLEARAKDRNAADGANDEVEMALLGKKIKFSASGFFQSNMDALEKAIPKICGGLSGRNALDLYSGCGTFSMFLSDSFESVTMVERDKNAVAFAQVNMAGRKRASFAMPCAEWTKSSGAKDDFFDAAVIDPPRTGMERETREWLRSSRVHEIRSLSCDPSTHARDVAFLLEGGYSLESLSLLDFYPNTSHIESLAVLKWKG